MIKNLPDGKSSPVLGGATPLNVTVNYSVLNAATGAEIGEPCAIQFGTGPLLITVSNFFTAPDPVKMWRPDSVSQVRQEAVQDRLANERKFRHGMAASTE